MSCCPPPLQGVVEKHQAGTGYDERLRVGWDFAQHHLIQQGATLTGPVTVTGDTVEGNQDGLLTVEAGSATIVGTRVVCWVRGGTPQTTYVLKCHVLLSDGHELVERLQLDLSRLGSPPVPATASTSATAVAGLLGANYDGCTPLGPYLAMAASVLERVLSCAAEKGITLTETTQQLLASLLAAHFYQQSDPGYVSKSTADASATYAGELGKYYESTRYGQSALMVDPSGCLAEEQAGLGGDGAGPGGARAGGFWLGSTDCRCGV